MQTLPLPPLEQTISTFLSTIAPISSAGELKKTESLAQDFLAGEGRQLQKALEEYAKTQAQEGKSWVSDYWLDGYLSGRETKALCSNVGFQLHFATEKTGLARAAQLIHLLTKTHRDYLQNSIPPSDDGRGNPLSMDGWAVLKGAMREPKAGCDDMYFSTGDACNRHISILHNGNHYALPVSNARAEVFSEQSLLKALQGLSENTNSLPFSVVSALPSEAAENYLQKLCANTHNQKLYGKLKDSLFCVSLFDTEQQNDEMALLKQHTFLPGHAWQYKPFTYQIDLGSDFVCSHVEHTGLDGGTFKAILHHAFAQSDTPESHEENSLSLENWQIDPSLEHDIKTLVESVRSEAKQMSVQKFTVDYSSLTQKISHDALVQFSLIYAQLAVFNQVRNTYEAVDTRHYLAGRTECLRPNTAPALHLCQKLIAGKAGANDLNTALQAHKNWVVGCKTGRGIDRHLYALSCRASQSQAFFDKVNSYYGCDFLSTSTLGDQSPIRRFIFAPTSEQGFGVSYSFGDTHYEYCLIANGNSVPHAQAMEGAIKTGAEKLIALAAACQ